MPHPSKRRVLAITESVEIGMAFSAPGHLEVWEIPISFIDPPTSRDRVYDAIKNFKPTTVILAVGTDDVLREGVRAVCRTLKTDLVFHSSIRARHILGHAEERLEKLRSGRHSQSTVGNDEILALAHAMVHLDEITRDHTAKELLRT